MSKQCICSFCFESQNTSTRRLVPICGNSSIANRTALRPCFLQHPVVWKYSGPPLATVSLEEYRSHIPRSKHFLRRTGPNSYHRNSLSASAGMQGTISKISAMIKCSLILNPEQRGARSKVCTPLQKYRTKHVSNNHNNLHEHSPHTTITCLKIQKQKTTLMSKSECK